MVFDEAGWHTERALHISTSLPMVPLPANAPKLIPITYIGLYPRERYLSRRLPASEEAVAIQFLRAYPASPKPLHGRAGITRDRCIPEAHATLTFSAE
jgi:hypothetical protein